MAAWDHDDLRNRADNMRRKERAASGGRKDDQGKDPWHLAPWDACRAIVLRFGAEKCAARNWEKGMAWSRPYGAVAALWRADPASDVMRL